MRSDRYLMSSAKAEIRPARAKQDPKANAGVPLMLHHDRHVCWEATDYLLHLLLVRRRKLSTIKTYADKLSLFIQFIDNKRLTFSDVTDAHFMEYRDQLLQRHGQRSHNEINSLLLRAFHMLLWLQFVQRVFDKRRVIAYEGEDAQIILCRKKVTYRDAKGKRRSNEAIDHPALLEPNAKARRAPIAESSIELLWLAIPKLSPNSYRRSRAELLLSAFEATGERRQEAANMTVAAIVEAEKTGQLEIRNSKSSKASTREVPIPTELLRRAKAFIAFDRAEKIKSGIAAGRFKRDHGYLLVTNYGDPWSERSITEEVAKLRELAGLREPAHPHLFRNKKLTLAAHEFITAAGPSADRSMIAVKLTSISGHKSLESLVPYIDTAFRERPAWMAMDRALTAREQASLARHKLVQIHSELSNSGDSGNATKLVKEATEILKTILEP